ncbi:MAG: type IX secretion system membrane protein PorP/SprF [Paramuribaculum sp.]|nr:type IX secretion system membrane protein PorP/SprF [Paramuribaculum sp.]
MLLRPGIRRLLSVLLVIVSVSVARAQSDAQLTQYFEVPSYYNPAAIGLTDSIRIRLGSRLQWVGIDRAPRTFLGTANTPFKFLNKRFAVGVVAQQETAGLFSNLTIGAQLGYKLKLWKGELTAAVQVGLVNEVFRGSDVYIPDDDDYHDSSDNAIPQTDLSGNSIDIGVGVWYSHPRFWAGLSCTHITEPTITFSDENHTSSGSMSSGSSTSEGETAKEYEFGLTRVLYFMAGGNIPIKNTLFEVMPSLLVKSDFSTFRGELTARMRWKKFITAGVGYRYDDSVIAMLGVEFKGFYIGYSFDYPTSAISKASHGSHEIMLGYSLKLNFSGKNINKHKSIRIM